MSRRSTTSSTVEEHVEIPVERSPRRRRTAPAARTRPPCAALLARGLSSRGRRRCAALASAAPSASDTPTSARATGRSTSSASRAARDGIDPGGTLAASASARPLVHQITNYVVMNETANATLALGALPVMAHAPEEVEEMAASPVRS